MDGVNRRFAFQFRSYGVYTPWPLHYSHLHGCFGTETTLSGLPLPKYRISLYTIEYSGHVVPPLPRFTFEHPHPPIGEGGRLKIFTIILPQARNKIKSLFRFFLLNYVFIKYKVNLHFLQKWIFNNRWNFNGYNRFTVRKQNRHAGGRLQQNPSDPPPGAAGVFIPYRKNRIRISAKIFGRSLKSRHFNTKKSPQKYQKTTKKYPFYNQNHSKTRKKPTKITESPISPLQNENISHSFEIMSEKNLRKKQKCVIIVVGEGVARTPYN